MKMSKLFRTNVLSSLALALGLSIALITIATPARAQEYHYNPEHRRPVEVTMHHLEEIATRVAPRGEDRRRFDDAIRHLQQFSDKLHERGQFDKGKLGDSIGNIESILDHAYIPEQSRQTLSRDVIELQRLRQRYEDGSYRYR